VTLKELALLDPEALTVLVMGYELAELEHDCAQPVVKFDKIVRRRDVAAARARLIEKLDLKMREHVHALSPHDDEAEPF
jgi:hypothetical protein